MISYNRLWETMKSRNMSQYRMIHYYNISSGQLNRLRNNMHVSTHTLEMLCRILDCRVEDVVEVVFDEMDVSLNVPDGNEENHHG